MKVDRHAAFHAAALCLVALAMTVLAACGRGQAVVPASSPSTASSTTPIPWIDSKATPLPTASTVADTPCQAADLKFTVGPAGAGHGEATQQILFTNISPNPCYFPGPPAAAVFPADGTKQQVTSSDSTAHTIDLAPGQTGYVVVGTPPTCENVGHPDVATNMDLTLATGEVVHVNDVWINVECGPPDTVLFDTQGAPSPVPVAQSVLKARLDVLGPVQAGYTLTYSVTLTNPSSDAVQLSPCPAYTQYLATAQPGQVQQTLLLNCANVGSLEPGGEATFEMKIQVPSQFSTGPAKLSWKLEVPDGTFAGTGVTILAP